MQIIKFSTSSFNLFNKIKMNNNKLIFPMYKWAQDLFPIAISITGPGVRQTLKYLQNINPELKIKSVKTGEKFFDWEVP